MISYEQLTLYMRYTHKSNEHNANTQTIKTNLFSNQF